jgi:hypothetical protein
MKKLLVFLFAMAVAFVVWLIFRDGGLWGYVIPAGVFGVFLAAMRADSATPHTIYDTVGMIGGVLLCGGGLLLINQEFSGPHSYSGGDFVGMILVVLAAGIGVYGYFGFLGMILPAPSGPRLKRPRGRQRPHSNKARNRDGHGGEIDPSVYGRNGGGPHSRPAPQQPPHIHIHMPAGGGQSGQPGTSKGPEAAPSDAARLNYQPAQGYSTVYAQQLFRESRVRGAPSNSKAASQLAGHCLAALGPHAGMAFLNAAARDDQLPRKTRQFYAQALMEMERRTAGN